MDNYISHIDITIFTTQANLVISDMPVEINIAGEKRIPLAEPMYKKIDKMGRVYIDRNLAEKEVLIVVVEPVPKDKIDYIKVGRSS